MVICLHILRFDTLYHILSGNQICLVADIHPSGIYDPAHSTRRKYFRRIDKHFLRIVRFVQRLHDLPGALLETLTRKLAVRSDKLFPFSGIQLIVFVAYQRCCMVRFLQRSPDLFRIHFRVDDDRRRTKFLFSVLLMRTKYDNIVICQIRPPLQIQFFPDKKTFYRRLHTLHDAIFFYSQLR